MRNIQAGLGLIFHSNFCGAGPAIFLTYASNENYFDTDPAIVANSSHDNPHWDCVTTRTWDANDHSTINGF
jgi:hypothetical protein